MSHLTEHSLMEPFEQQAPDLGRHNIVMSYKDSPCEEACCYLSDLWLLVLCTVLALPSI